MRTTFAAKISEQRHTPAHSSVNYRDARTLKKYFAFVVKPQITDSRTPTGTNATDYEGITNEQLLLNTASTAPAGEDAEHACSTTQITSRRHKAQEQ